MNQDCPKLIVASFYKLKSQKLDINNYLFRTLDSIDT